MAGEASRRSSQYRRHAEHIIAQYEHHFAGQPRATRDAAWLDELIVRLTEIQSHVQHNGGEFGDVALDHISRLRIEHTRILAARCVEDPVVRSSDCAARINHQFAVYRSQLAGYARLSCRPQLLRRVIASLEQVQVDMAEPVFERLADRGIHNANRAIVAANLGELRHELIVLEAAHRQCSVAERLNSLVAAAESMLSAMRREYTQDDNVRDRLFELEWQLVALSWMCPAHDVDIERQIDRIQGAFERYVTAV